MNYFEFVCVYPSRCKALAPTRLVAPPTDRGHRPYRNADGRYERAGVGEFPPSLNARFFVAQVSGFEVEVLSTIVVECCMGEEFAYRQFAFRGGPHRGIS